MKSDKSLCLRATRQPRVLAVATTLPPYAGHWGSVCAASCHFDDALGTRWDLGSTHFAQACHSVRKMYRRVLMNGAFCDITMFFIRHGSSHTVLRNMLAEICGSYFRSKAINVVVARLDLRWQNIAIWLLRTCKYFSNISAFFFIIARRLADLISRQNWDFLVILSSSWTCFLNHKCPQKRKILGKEIDRREKKNGIKKPIKENVPTSWCRSVNRQIPHPGTVEALNSVLSWFLQLRVTASNPRGRWITSGSARQNSKHTTALIIHLGTFIFSLSATVWGILVIKPSKRSLISSSLEFNRRCKAHMFAFPWVKMHCRWTSWKKKIRYREVL